MPPLSCQKTQCLPALLLPYHPQELADALHLLNSKADDSEAAAASDKRRLEGVVKTLEGRLSQAMGVGGGIVPGWPACWQDWAPGKPQPSKPRVFACLLRVSSRFSPNAPSLPARLTLALEPAGPIGAGPHARGAEHR